MSDKKMQINGFRLFQAFVSMNNLLEAAETAWNSPSPEQFIYITELKSKIDKIQRESNILMAIYNLFTPKRVQIESTR